MTQPYCTYDSPLLQKIRQCTACAESLPFPPRPVLNFAAPARILIVGQAPGTRVHQTGIPWNDPSGERLRDWLDVDAATFYDPQRFAIAPMGFCYPGKGKSGDLPPRPECAPRWMPAILSSLPNLETILLIGQYAQKFFLKDKSAGVTQNVKNWRKFAPELVPLPHPSPRNNLWLRRHPWFQSDILPHLKVHCHKILSKTG